MSLDNNGASLKIKKNYSVAGKLIGGVLCPRNEIYYPRRRPPLGAPNGATLFPLIAASAFVRWEHPWKRHRLLRIFMNVPRPSRQFRVLGLLRTAGIRNCPHETSEKNAGRSAHLTEALFGFDDSTYFKNSPPWKCVRAYAELFSKAAACFSRS